jgi:hypothetical protein
LGIRNRFRLDITLVYKFLDNIPLHGSPFLLIRQQFPELGTEKVRSIKEWSGDLGLTIQTKHGIFLTPLGRATGLCKNTKLENKMQEIMYYKLATNPKTEVFSIFVNEFLYEVSKTIDQCFDLNEAKVRILNNIDSQANPKYIKGEVRTALNTLINENGLNKIGMVMNLGNDLYKVYPQRPDWRSFSYMLYDSWPENTSRINVSQLFSTRNSLGRIFFMDESQLLVLLSKLEQERAIALEIVADLNQIGLNPTCKASDFLEMIIRDEG